jgi:CRISPR system Cascade subunit CasA
MPSSHLLLHNLLDEPLLGVEDDQGHLDKVTLPGLLARLSHAKPTALTAVQAHQQHPVHAFLVQLAALALARAGETELAHDEATWRALLLGAAKQDGAGAEAFALVVGDLARPAFLQAPIPEGNLDALKNAHTRPGSELDVLITSKNHDVKIDRVDRPSVEHWIFSLLTLQTMQGFLGAGNYGIARMNGGFASRPCVAYAPDQGAAPRFLRDVRVLLDARDTLTEGFGFGTKGHLGLVWCAPWSGATSLGFAELDPFFIEICRRVRLTVAADGTIVAHRGSSKVARIDAKESTGNTGDAWTPVAHDGKGAGKALTMPEAGFGYDRVQQLLFDEDYRPGAAGKPGAGDRLWVGQVLVRGQGKTGGYHERWVPMPVKARRIFARREDRDKLGARSKAWVELAATARLKLLKPALITLLQGGPDKLKFDDDRADSYLRRLDTAIDDDFFGLLFEHADDAPELADAAFEKQLVALARAQLDAARESLPVPSARRWRAEAHADRVFFGAAHKHFKLAFPPAATSAEAAPTSGESP